MHGIQNAAHKYNIDLYVTYAGGMFGFFFTDQEKIKNYNQVKSCNNLMFENFFKIMLSKGIYFAPSSFEAGFISSKHSQKDISFTIKSAEEAFKEISIKNL